VTSIGPTPADVSNIWVLLWDNIESCRGGRGEVVRRDSLEVVEIGLADLSLLV
jgi:hypothetical protein